MRGLIKAGLRLLDASRELEAARESLARAPELEWTDAPLLVDIASERWQAASAYLQYVTSEVALRQVEVLSGLACGELKAEHPSDHRPRIVRTPRIAFVRAFLAVRRRRVADRISPVLQRRRRTPRPAALLVPPRTCQGRAPPFFCALAVLK